MSIKMIEDNTKPCKVFQTNRIMNPKYGVSSNSKEFHTVFFKDTQGGRTFDKTT